MIGRGGVHWSYIIRSMECYPIIIHVPCDPELSQLFYCGGSNSATVGGSLLIIFESVISYIVQYIQKIQQEKLKAMEISLAAEKAWDYYFSAYFPGTVHGGKCRSWYKGGEEDGRVMGLWRGSTVHCSLFEADKNPSTQCYNEVIAHLCQDLYTQLA
jgi:hypothetical protein